MQTLFCLLPEIYTSYNGYTYSLVFFDIDDFKILSTDSHINEASWGFHEL